MMQIIDNNLILDNIGYWNHSFTIDLVNETISNHVFEFVFNKELLN